MGVDLCVDASPRQKRNGRSYDEDNTCYKVRGGFGEDKDEEMLIPDTRWVSLRELVANMDEGALAALDRRHVGWEAAEARKAAAQESERGACDVRPHEGLMRPHVLCEGLMRPQEGW